MPVGGGGGGVTFMVCTYDAGLADMKKIKMEWVTTFWSEIKPSGTRLTYYLNCGGLIC